MPTTVTVDDDLLARAQGLTGVERKSALVETAIKELIKKEERKLRRTVAPETEEQLIEDYRNFRDECIEVKAVFDMMNELYTDDPVITGVMLETGALFFSNLNRILIQFYFIQVARLTDPAGSHGNRNLTIRHLNQQLEYHHRLNQDIENATKRLECYRCKILLARRKRVAHLDLKQSRQLETLGTHAEEQGRQFHVDLQQYCYLVAEALGEDRIDFQYTGGEGDACDVIKALELSLLLQDPVYDALDKLEKRLQSQYANLHEDTS